MREKKEARQSLQAGRARRSTVRMDADIVAEKLERDWERGCMLLGLAYVALILPMLALGFVSGWV